MNYGRRRGWMITCKCVEQWRNVSEIKRWWNYWWRNGNLFCIHAWKYNWSKLRVWRWYSDWPSRRGEICGISGPRLFDIQYQIINRSVRRMNWCDNYSGIVDHVQIWCRPLKRCICSCRKKKTWGQQRIRDSLTWWILWRWIGVNSGSGGGTLVGLAGGEKYVASLGQDYLIHNTK